MNFNKEKWLALIIFLGVVLFLLISGIGNTDFFKNYSELIGTISTLSFVYLTYETLRQTNQAKISPYITVGFITVSGLDENFINEHRGLNINDHIKRLLEDFKKEDPMKKDLVFVEIENIGDTTAIETRIEIDYNKQTYGKESKQTFNLPLGTLKKDDRIIELVDVFEVPTKDDSFKIERCITYFSTVSRKNVGDGLKKNDVSDSLNYKSNDENITIAFRK